MNKIYKYDHHDNIIYCVADKNKFDGVTKTYVDQSFMIQSLERLLCITEISEYNTAVLQLIERLRENNNE